MSLHQVNSMRTTMLDDELAEYSAETYVGRTAFPAESPHPKVLGKPLTPPPGRRPLEPWKVTTEKEEAARYKIEPGWVEFHEVTWRGAPLREMDPVAFGEGTRLVLDIKVQWKHSVMNVSYVGQSTGSGPPPILTRAVYYKTGACEILEASVREYPKGLATPLPASYPTSTLDAEAAQRPETLTFILAAFGKEGAVDHASQNQRYYMPMKAFTFEPV